MRPSRSSTPGMHGTLTAYRFRAGRPHFLGAEHTFNASTFTARVVTSTLSDNYSAVIDA